MVKARSVVKGVDWSKRDRWSKVWIGQSAIGGERAIGDQAGEFESKAAASEMVRSGLAVESESCQIHVVKREVVKSDVVKSEVVK